MRNWSSNAKGKRDDKPRSYGNREREGDDLSQFATRARNSGCNTKRFCSWHASAFMVSAQEGSRNQPIGPDLHSSRNRTRSPLAICLLAHSHCARRFRRIAISSSPAHAMRAAGCALFSLDTTKDDPTAPGRFEADSAKRSQPVRKSRAAPPRPLRGEKDYRVFVAALAGAPAGV